MRLEILQTSRSVAINDIFILKWRYYGPKGDILDYEEIPIFWYHILLYYIED